MISQKRLAAACALALTAIVLIWTLLIPLLRHSRTIPPVSSGNAVSTSAKSLEATTNVQSEVPPAEYSQLSLKNQTRQSAVAAYVERGRRDKQADWKVPIRFYGKIIDQSEKPVADANVQFEWTDLSVHGTSEKITKSDAQGLFSLVGVKGKSLGIRISKEGYYDASHKENQTSFEYASPAERRFYEPDETHPVIFLLRKKGEAEPLLQRAVEFKLPGDGSGQAVDLLAGKTADAGPLQIKTWKPPYSPEPRPTPYDWRITVEIPGGGFVEHEDLFPFTAPESGYVVNVDLHMSPGLGSEWRSFVDKNYYFYYGQPRRYGRLQLRTDGDRRIVFIDYYLNPRPGSRNLEFDPGKTIKP